MNKSKITSVRLSPEILKKLKSSKIKLNNLITVLLEEYLDLKKCPTCGQYELNDDDELKNK